MSIDRDYGQIVFLCDGKHCNEFLETETKNFNEAKELLDQSNWQIRKVENEWLHVCPTCLEAETL